MIQAGGFDILGHLDLIKVNNRDEKYFSAGSTAYRLAWRSLIPRIAAGGFTVEINTGGIIRRRIEEPYPAWEIRVAMNAEGIPAVITSDAHQPEHLGGYYDRARRSLIEADYTSHRIFTGRTAQGATWREESLAPVAPS